MGELFKGDFNPFGHYYHDAWAVGMEKVKADLAPIANRIKTVFEVEHNDDDHLIQQLTQAVSAYFAQQCFVQVDSVAIIDCRPDGLDSSDDFYVGDDYLIDYTLGDYTMDEALEAALPNTIPSSTPSENSSVEDVLFEQVDLEAERNPKPPPPTPVYDDYGCYC